ncbi:MAG TPA: tRNA (guanosine(46)-N7)-methyltransferase TrmB [Anaeromyxobacteraceae bacterium]|nr:tRNA (guanosine(46)-N7)-methyltransferase TrmB [Anaeromyxobacteraceae bacterium]
MPGWDSAADGPLELEIGSGHGGYALAFARLRPHATLVAIEQRRAFAAALAAKAEKRGHRNLHAICGDARLLVPRLFRAGSLAAVHVHFPDPWWKRRHERRRLLDPSMARLILQLLAPGGHLDFRTDVERYAGEAIVRLEEAGFENASGRGQFAPHDPAEIPSTREKRYLESGAPVWRLRMLRPIIAGR